MNSRISNQEMRWFIHQTQTAPWADVPPASDLRHADPMESGGLWAAADALCMHFMGRRGVAHGEVSKILHLMRPHLAPIVDTRIRWLYRIQARQVAQTLRPHGTFKYQYSPWAGVRQDLLMNTGAIQLIRRGLAEDPEDRAQRIAAELSDLRLMDMASWPLEP